jgi:hypothetical protein
MKRSLIAIVTSCAAFLTIPGIALGTITEVGLTGTQVGQLNATWPTPACPGAPCLAVSRTTGFQVKVGADNQLVSIPKDGSIVAWTLSLGNPNKAQIAYFNAQEGGAPEAGLAILRAGPHLTYRLLASTPYQALTPYFGETVQFPLAQSIPVKKGQIIALTVPTWAPALALGFGNDTSWRASRAKAKCTDTQTPSMHTTLQSVVQYTCLYRTARLTYSATLVSTP